MVNKVPDTPDELIRLQRNIILSKLPQERAAMGIDMINTVYMVVKNSILKTHPNASKGELIAKIFERYYKNDFSPNKIAEISQAIINYHNKA
jgi:hypothetical protein